MFHLKNISELMSKASLVFLIAMLASCGTSQDDGQMVLAAKDYLAQNKLREAGLELKNALQINSDNAEARYLLGGINLEVGDFLSAEKEYRRAKQAGWSEAESVIGMYRALILGRKYQEVLDENVVKEAFTVTAKADLYALQAKAFAILGNQVAALVKIDEAEAQDADAVEVLRAKTLLLLSNKKFDEAANYVAEALVARPEDKELLLIAAIASIKLEDSDTAKDRYLKVIAMDPGHFVSYNGRRARIGMVKLYILEKDFDSAHDVLSPLLKQGGVDYEGDYLAGVLALQRGDLDLSKEHLLKVLKVAPGDPRLQLLLGTVSFSQKDHEQAAYYLSKYIAGVPDNMVARKLLARTYIILGQVDQAQSLLKNVVTDDESDAELLALVGLSNIKSGNISSGIDALQKAVRAAPENNALRNELAKAYIRSGETSNAIKQLNEVLAKKGGEKQQAEILLVMAFVREGDYDKAIGKALDILSDSADDPSILAFVGNVFAISGDKSEARKYFNRSLELAPESVAALMLLASLEETEDNNAAAIELYKRAIGNKKDFVDPLLALARLAEKENDSSTRLNWLEQARESSPQDLRSRTILAENYLKTGNLTKAEEVIKELQAISPNHPSGLLLQARLMLSKKRFNEASSVLQNLVTREPTSLFARTLLGETQFRLGSLDAARKQLNIVLDKQEYYVPALLLLSKVEEKAGNYDNALVHANKIIKVKPGVYLGYLQTGNVFYTSRRFKDAFSSYETALKLHYSEAMVIKISDTAIKNGDLQYAVDTLSKGVESFPENMQIHLLLGNSYLSSGQTESAIKSFEKVVSLKSDQIIALNNLAWLYNKTDAETALDYAEKAYKLSPDSAAVQDTYGWILLHNNQLEKGLHILEQAMKKLAGVPDVRYHYAVALHRSGRTQEAEEILTQLVDGDEQFEDRSDASALLNK